MHLTLAKSMFTKTFHYALIHWSYPGWEYSSLINLRDLWEANSVLRYLFTSISFYFLLEVFDTVDWIGS